MEGAATNTPRDSSATAWTIGLLCRQQKRCTSIQWKSIPVAQGRLEEDVVADLQLLYQKEKASVVVFNGQGVPVFLSSHFSGRDAALLLHLHDQQHGRRSGHSSDTGSRDRTLSPQKFSGALRGGDSTATDGILSERESTPVNPQDLALVERMIQDGQAPFIPANRPYWLQWLLMRVTELIFCRQTVRFFACGPLKYHRSTLYCFPIRQYPTVRGTVALTIDDGPCRFRDRRQSRMAHVLQLLQQYNAHATFMVIARFLTEDHEEDMIQLLQQGHELGNHGILDAALNKCSPAEVASAVDECSAKIRHLQQRAGVDNDTPWFRAPHGKYNRIMADCITARGMRNVMCDTYASDPVIQDGEWIGDELARKSTDGSIVLLHMPERGFRAWCGVALQRTLAGLTARGFRIVTVSALERIALQNKEE